MSPEQLKNLQQLSQLFENGLAGPKQIKQLSELLTEVNVKADNSNASFEVFSS
jgi:hypothetical protein